MLHAGLVGTSRVMPDAGHVMTHPSRSVLSATVISVTRMPVHIIARPHSWDGGGPSRVIRSPRMATRSGMYAMSMPHRGRGVGEGERL